MRTACPISGTEPHSTGPIRASSRRLDHRGSGSVADQDAGAAVGPVGHRRHAVRADDQRARRRTGPHRLSAVASAWVKPAHTTLRSITAGEPMPSRAATRAAVFGERSSAVEVATRTRSMSAGVEAGAGQRLGGRVRGQLVHGLVGTRDVAGTDADPAADPFVAGVDQFGEVVIGEHLGGLIVPDRDNARASHAGHGGSPRYEHSVLNIRSHPVFVATDRYRGARSHRIHCRTFGALCQRFASMEYARPASARGVAHCSHLCSHRCGASHLFGVISAARRRIRSVADAMRPRALGARALTARASGAHTMGPGAPCGLDDDLVLHVQDNECVTQDRPGDETGPGQSD